ncbi:MAG: hypothetical protein NTY64_04430, partial [Deltaproteobacteria bacterium]|nr:hypothetical protein [Deltaproteobacteria bacterium]
NQDAKIGLGEILINRVQVRNLESALEILAEVRDKTGYIQELINRAKRWRGELEIPRNFNYKIIQLIPMGFLLEERKRCRALIKSLKRENKMDEITSVLDHFYRIGILHDAAEHIVGKKYYFTVKEQERKKFDQILEKIAARVHQYSYEKNGRLVRANFLSNNDYKLFELVFGKSNKLLNPADLC